MRADERNPLPFPGQRKHILIFQEHKGIRRCRSCRIPMRFTQNQFLFFLFIRVLVRIFKKAQPVLQLQYPKHRLVHQSLADDAFLHQTFKIPAITGGTHINVHPRFYGKPCGLLPVSGDPMIYHLLNGCPVRNHHSLKAHFLPEHFPQQFFIPGGGNPIQRVERGHHHCHSRFHRLPIRGQIIVPQSALRKLHRIIIPSGNRRAVGRIMFDAGGNLPLLFQIRTALPGLFSLITLHDGSGKLTVQPGILSRGLHHTAPPGIPHQIHHRGKGQMQPGCRRLPRRNLRTFFGQLRVKAAALGQRNGKHRAVTVNNIRHKYKRDAVRLFLHIIFLDRLQPGCPDHSKHCPCLVNLFPGIAHRILRPGNHPFLLQIKAAYLQKLLRFFR